MRLRFFFAATFATFDSAGKLMVYDADFEEIRPKSFPASIDQLYLVVKFVVDDDELDKEHDIMIRSFGEKIEETEETPIKFIPRRRPNAVSPQTGYGFYLRYPNPVFPKPGVYGFELFVDNQSLGRLELHAAGRLEDEK